jgi:hypothetical protein
VWWRFLPILSICIFASCASGAEEKPARGAASTVDSASADAAKMPATDDSELANAVDTTDDGVFVLAYDVGKPPPIGPDLGPRIGAATLEARVATRNGVLTIEREGRPRFEHALYRLRVNGQLMMADSSSERVSVSNVLESVPGLHHVFVIRNVEGGTACPALFQVVEVSPGNAVVSPPFGSCAEELEIAVDSGEVRMRFPGHYTLAESMRDDFVEPPSATWVYRGKGRVELLKEPRRRVANRSN